MPSAADEIVGLYERHARAWAAERQRSSFLERAWVERFAALLPTRASILDVGCGTGEPIAGSLLDAGFEVTGIDSSPTLIEMCRTRRPGGDWLVADMRTLALGRTFQGIVAWGQLLPPGARPAAPNVSDLRGARRAEGSATVHERYRQRRSHRQLCGRTEDPHCGQHTVWLAQRER